MNTPNPKCPRCKCYWKPDETDIKTSGLLAKTCKKCRISQKKEKSIIKADEPDDNKEEPKTIKIKGIDYEVKGKILDKEMARKVIPDFHKRYEDIEDIPDENVVIPDNCFKYVLGAKMDDKMMEDLGFRITSADDEDNNIYPDDDDNIFNNKFLEEIKYK
jgi:DNA-directed RNA polymerase subunit M/transcription elongation factor TFIIS